MCQNHDLHNKHVGLLFHSTGTVKVVPVGTSSVSNTDTSSDMEITGDCLVISHSDKPIYTHHFKKHGIANTKLRILWTDCPEFWAPVCESQARPMEASLETLQYLHEFELWGHTEPDLNSALVFTSVTRNDSTSVLVC